MDYVEAFIDRLTDTMPSKETTNRRRCPVCKGSGIDPTLNRRYTTGGHDDRSCRECHGECYIDIEDSNEANEKTEDN